MAVSALMLVFVTLVFSAVVAFAVGLAWIGYRGDRHSPAALSADSSE